MKRTESCSKTPACGGCHAFATIEASQPFPQNGLLADNLNLSVDRIDARLHGIQDRTYSYVVRSVRWNKISKSFEQRGSAPNFQGGVLTLCTCKHQMRSSQLADDWEGVWIAGFTSRTIYERRHWLFYLAAVQSAHESHCNLWNSVDSSSRDAKAAHLHYLGDMFKPRKPLPTGDERYSPSRYYTPPIHSHRRNPSDQGWHKDINYRHALSLRRPPLLLADPAQTFLWEKPMVFLDNDHCRDYFAWASLEELLDQLREAQS
jgi:hypothetical protein